MLKCIRYNLVIVGLLFCCSWGFHAHRTVNKSAVYTLPKELSSFFLTHIDEIESRSILADKRRYIDTSEACKHYIDLDLYGLNPFDTIPVMWKEAKERFTLDTLKNRGILPWVITWEYKKLVWAMDSGTATDVINTAANLGHYVADACVPLHTTSNYNGQFSNQHGVHALWESRIPESFSQDYDYYVGKAVYLNDPIDYTWMLIEESFNLVDSTLSIEKKLSSQYSSDDKYRPMSKNGKIIHEYTNEFINDYESSLDGMVEKRMKSAIRALGSYWYSALIDAGQPDLTLLTFGEESEKNDEKRSYTPKRVHE